MPAGRRAAGPRRSSSASGASPRRCARSAGAEASPRRRPHAADAPGGRRPTAANHSSRSFAAPGSTLVAARSPCPASDDHGRQNWPGDPGGLPETGRSVLHELLLVVGVGGQSIDRRRHYAGNCGGPALCGGKSAARFRQASRCRLRRRYMLAWTARRPVLRANGNPSKYVESTSSRLARTDTRFVIRSIRRRAVGKLIS
jgi:hypothetical protein